jgi:hypothetical protein
MAEALTEEMKGSRKGPACSTGAFIVNLESDEDRRDILDALADKSVQTAVIYRAMKKMSDEVSVTSIAKHRKNECQCSKIAPDTVPVRAAAKKTTARKS